MLIQIIRLTTYRALFLALTLSTPGALLAENPSNPLAKSVNTDIRAQYLGLRDGSDLTDYFVDGGFMATEKLKVKYELHFWDTNVTGSSEQDWENITLIPLVQHYSEYSGDELNLTAARLIGLWSLSDGYWGKLDAKLPYDWGAGVGLRFVY